MLFAAEVVLVTGNLVVDFIVAVAVAGLDLDVVVVVAGVDLIVVLVVAGVGFIVVVVVAGVVVVLVVAMSVAGFDVVDMGGVKEITFSVDGSDELAATVK